jgi:uncharacterized protein (DUF2235 family)
VLEQVWFAGCHGDVGGGGSYPGLADVALGWMMRKAHDLGLEFDDAVLNHYSSVPSTDALAQVDDSWRLFWGIPNPRQISTDASLSNSVAIRCQSIHAYRPKNLTFVEDSLANTYDTIDVIS